jgi:hypothetical protein
MAEKVCVIVPAWREKFEKIPVLRGKVGIVLMSTGEFWYSTYPAWREKDVMTHVL